MKCSWKLHHFFLRIRCQQNQIPCVCPRFKLGTSQKTYSKHISLICPSTRKISEICGFPRDFEGRDFFSKDFLNRKQGFSAADTIFFIHQNWSVIFFIPKQFFSTVFEFPAHFCVVYSFFFKLSSPIHSSKDIRKNYPFPECCLVSLLQVLFFCLLLFPPSSPFPLFPSSLFLFDLFTHGQFSDLKVHLSKSAAS